jgi:chromosome segregation ATPase
LKIIKGSSRIADVMSKVKDLRIHLQSLKKNPELLKTDKKVALMSKEILKLVSAFHQHIESKNQQNVEIEKARLSLAESRVKEHTKALDNARDRLDKEEERKDKNLEAMRQSKRELADLMANMKNLDLTKVEMDGVISCLQEGLTYLSKVEQHWNNLANFFQTLNIIISVNLNKSINDFIEGVKDGDIVETLVKPALVASGMCVQICNCASIYRAVSEEFVMPEITKVTGNVSLSKEDAKKRKNDIEMETGSTHEKVRQLIDTKRKVFMDAFEDNLETQQTKLLQAITQ